MAGRNRSQLVFALVLVVATAIGLFLRLQDVGSESFWSDEVTQLEWTDQPFGAFLQQRWERADPPLNELIVWTWNRGLRQWAPERALDEAAVRAPVVLFGVLAIPIIGLAAASAFGRWPGAWAALLLATNPHHVRYSQEARMYALTVLLSATAILFLARTLRHGRRSDAWLFGVFGAAASYSHFYAVLTLVAATCATVVAHWRSTPARTIASWRADRSPLGTLLRGELLGMALIAPYLLAVGAHVWLSGQGTRLWLAALGPPGLRAIWFIAKDYAFDLLHTVVSDVAPGSIDAWAVVVGLATLAVALVAGCVAHREDEPNGLRLHLLAIAIAPPLLVFAVSRFRPIYHPRYLLAITPALVLLCVRARPAALLATAVATPILVGLWLEPRYHRLLENPDYREAAREIVSKCGPDDVVQGAVLHRRPLQFYMRQMGGPCTAYEVTSSRGGVGGLAAAAAAVPMKAGARRFDIGTEPLHLVRSQAAGAAVDHAVSSDGHKRALLFVGKSDPTLRVWLNEP